MRESDRWYQTLVDTSTDAIGLADLDGKLFLVNERAARLFGYDRPDEMVGIEVASLAEPDQVEAIRETIRKRITLEEPSGGVSHTRLRRRDGSYFLAEASSSAVIGQYGHPIGVTFVVRDITEQVRIEERLRSEAERLSAIVSVQHDIAQLDLDPDTVTRVIAERARDITRASGSAVGMIEGDRIVFHIATRALAEHAGYSVPLGGSLPGLCVETGELQLTNNAANDARVDPISTAVLGTRSLMVVPLRHDGEIVGVLQVMSLEPSAFDERDADSLQLLAGFFGTAMAHAADFEAKRVLLEVRTEALQAIRESEERLAFQARHDTLTGLPNRLVLNERLSVAIQAAGQRDRNLALLLMDLDRFKEINDTFGHHHGDVLLQQAAARLFSVVHESDTVARLGGDEFAIILPEADEVRAVRVAEEVRAALDEPFSVEGQHVSIATSVGISLFPQDGSDTSTLLRHADVAMYVAKRAHAGHAFYAPHLDQHDPARLTLVGELRRAIERRELSLHYQPKIHLHTGCDHHVEALARWYHPEHGPIAPDRFIRIAEETGLIAPLTAWVLEEALGQCRLWRDAGHDMSVAVNLSPRVLHSPRLVTIVEETLARLDIDGAALEVELTESGLMADPEGASIVLRRLHDIGVRISIDDFGTGYSSLAYLKQLPVDELKIDRSFVRDMRCDDSDAVIVRSVIDLGHNLGLQVTAEGIEDGQAFDMLRRMGCDMGQGYWLSRPLAPPDLAAWLEERPAHAHA